MYKFDREKYDKRMQWFTHDRFGMFIHWGLYAIPARGEWVRSAEEIAEEDYIACVNEFNPKDCKAGRHEVRRAHCKAPRRLLPV